MELPMTYRADSGRLFRLMSVGSTWHVERPGSPDYTSSTPAILHSLVDYLLDSRQIDEKQALELRNSMK